MIDYWEAIGRLAYDKNLNNEFEKVVPPVQNIPRVSPQVNGETFTALNIPKEQYLTVQGFFQKVLSERYLSLMSAGELLWTYSFQKTRDALAALQSDVAQTQPPSGALSTHYFITLGLLIADKDFRHKVQNQDPDTLVSLQGLSVPEKNQIASLASNPAFDQDSMDFCAVPWIKGCNVLSVFWDGHLHPLGVDANTWAS